MNATIELRINDGESPPRVICLAVEPRIFGVAISPIDRSDSPFLGFPRPEKQERDIRETRRMIAKEVEALTMKLLSQFDTVNGYPKDDPIR